MLFLYISYINLTETTPQMQICLCYTLIVELSKNSSFIEEIANSVTHGLGLLLVIFGVIILFITNIKAVESWRIIGISIFGVTTTLTYIISTLYHGLYFTKAKSTFKRLDQSSIYLLIAGTYTAFIIIYLRSQMGFIILSIVWVLSIFGICYKVLYIFRKKTTPERGKLQILVYLILGWLSLFLIVPIINNMPILTILFLTLGGGFYTFGTIFIVWKSLRFNHTIWHLFVMFGTTCHFFALSYI